MKRSSLASGPRALICPLCEVGELFASGHGSRCCESCPGRLSGAMLETLRHITALPEGMGSHACECGYPEMRSLPDGTYHCPACGSEVLPIGAPLVDWMSGEPGEAYWCGWLDGRYRETGSFADNPNLARWDAASDRLAYYRAIVQAAKPARAGTIGTRTPTRSSSDEEV